MDGRPPGDRSIDPAELLRGALEKIVFFECRVAQLESELRAAVQTAERARADASAAQQKAIGFEEALAGARGARVEADRRAAELGDRVRLLEAERERLLSGLVEQARLAGAPGGAGETSGDQADLAGFIAELRAEIELLRAFKTSVEGAAASGNPLTLALSPAGAGEREFGRGAGEGARVRGNDPHAHDSVGTIAGRLAAEGRASVTASDTAALRGQLATESDRVLFEESITRLRAADPAVRLRAVQRLAALGPRAAAPLLAAAVGREPDAEVKVALLGALSRVEEPFAADLAAAALQDGRPAVRAAALEAYARLAPDGSEPRLLGAMGDESPIVRRRAALLLGYSRSDRADEALSAALRDADGGVARAAAAALAGRPSADAQRALARALEHGDARVRRSAAETLGRWTGERVRADAPDHERRRAARRIAERLAGMAPAEVRSAVMGAAERKPAGAELLVRRFTRQGVMQAELRPSTSTPAAPLSPTLSPARAGAREIPGKPLSPAGAGAREVSAGVKGGTVGAAPVSAVGRLARAAVAVVEAPAAAVSQGGALEEAIVAELRGALRGRATLELAELHGAPPARIEAILQQLAARGAVVARGPRWYVG